MHSPVGELPAMIIRLATPNVLSDVMGDEIERAGSSKSYEVAPRGARRDPSLKVHLKATDLAIAFFAPMNSLAPSAKRHAIFHVLFAQHKLLSYPGPIAEDEP